MLASIRPTSRSAASRSLTISCPRTSGNVAAGLMNRVAGTLGCDGATPSGCGGGVNRLSRDSWYSDGGAIRVASELSCFESSALDGVVDGCDRCGDATIDCPRSRAVPPVEGRKTSGAAGDGSVRRARSAADGHGGCAGIAADGGGLPTG